MSSPRAAFFPRRLAASFALTVSLVVGLSSIGCIGAQCGAGPVQSQGNGAKVTADGVVIYEHTPIGSSVSFEIPVKDTADIDETLVGANITGDDADSFQVNTTFPIDMPAGKKVHVEVTFQPKKSGTMSADLNIETENMGVSPAIELRGVGVDG